MRECDAGAIEGNAMIRALALSLVFCCFSVTEAPATGRCSRPYAPQIPEGGTASRDEILSARSDTTAFVTASDLYQRCLLQTPTGQNQSLAEDNEQEKVRVARDFNNALRAFNRSHAEGVQLSSR
jgi:hypothetical protein